MAIIPRPIITKDLIYSHINSLDIFQHYCSTFKKEGEFFYSEFRNEKHPSCQISWWKGDLIYSDFGDIKGVRAIEYVMLKYNLKYYDALEKIYYDLKINGNSIKNSICDNSNRVYSSYSGISRQLLNKPTTIRIKRRNWKECDKRYWYDRYSISRDTLESFGVVPISHFWIDSRKLDNQMFIADELAYSYDYYWETVFMRKIYQPMRKHLGKWYSNNNNHVVQGEGMLPYSGELLIITSSLKEVMQLYELGFTAISPTNEQSWIPEQYLFKQQKRFKEIKIFFDTDETGKKKSIEFSEKWNIPYILIPEEYGIKDISDYVHIKGFDAGKKLMKELL